MNLNRIFLIGRLGQDVQARATQSGVPLATFSVAVDRNIKRPDGTWDKVTTWFNIVALNHVAERVLNSDLHKGSLVHVEGAMESFQKQDGTTGWNVKAIAVTSLTPRPKQDDYYGQQNFAPQGAFQGGGYNARPQQEYRQQPPAQGYQQRPAPQGFPPQPSENQNQPQQQERPEGPANQDVVPF